MRRLLIALICLGSLGCYRAHYVNFSPDNPTRSTHPSETVRVTGWQNFFLWGWAPGEERIDARRECGASDNIAAIDTRRTFVQGLIAAFAGYYINIYSPWNGAVTCHEQPPVPRSLPARSADDPTPNAGRPG